MEKTVKGSKVFTPEYILEIREGNYTKDEATTKILHECGQTRFPINPWQIARKLNFKVLEASFRNKSISGMMIDALEVPDVLKPFGSKRAIILNKDESKQMQSFTIAHELAHFVYDCNEQSNCFDAYHVSRDKGEHELNEGEQEEKNGKTIWTNLLQSFLCLKYCSENISIILRTETTKKYLQESWQESAW